MRIQQSILNLSDLLSFADFSTFTYNIPVERVESALFLTNREKIRRRRLLADQVLWLDLGMAIFRNEPAHEVARRLNICAQGLGLPSNSLLARSGLVSSPEPATGRK